MEDSMMDLLFVSDDGMTYGYDTNGDEIVDTLMGPMEINGQMTDATMYDSDSNGVFDTFAYSIDTDGDGINESLVIARDYDQEGTMDNIKIYTDSDLNGEAETVTNMHSDTENPDVAYRVEVDVDQNGDHQSDYHYEDIIPADGTDLQFTPTAMGSPAPDGTFDINTPEELVVGDPAEDMENWEFQGRTYRCALYSQKFVIEELRDIDIDIEEFAEIASENGWFTEESGTTSLNMDKMLEYYNIDHDVLFDADMEDLETALANGEKVIVSVDSGQIWDGEYNDIFSPATVSDHALQVIGIDNSDPNNPMVILNDSGSPTGRGEMVPLETFENAWGASDHQMIVCRA